MPFMLQLARADRTCPTSSPRMIHPCPIAVGVNVKSVRNVWIHQLCSEMYRTIGSTHQLLALPDQVWSPQTRALGCLLQQMPASSLTIGMLLLRWRSTTLLAKRPCSHKEPFLRPRGSGKLFLPNLRMKELRQRRSPKRLQAWSVIATKMNDSLTQHFTRTRLSWYC